MHIYNSRAVQSETNTNISFQWARENLIPISATVGADVVQVISIQLVLQHKIFSSAKALGFLVWK